jgi:hypothetical protein
MIIITGTRPDYGAVEMAAAADLHPERIQAVLPPDDRRIRRPAVFAEKEPAAGF